MPTSPPPAREAAPLDLSRVRFARNILETIGGTPLVRLNAVTSGLATTVLAKLESRNPGGSVKDRIGIAMVEAAEREGHLKPGGTVVECTSGNTGVGLAMAASLRGYRAIFVMPDKVAQEKRLLLRAYGAEVVICPTNVPPDSPDSYYEVAKRITRETPGAFLCNQYHNQANPEAHYRTTGPELWEQTGGQITHFVCSIGTGGTIVGVGRYLKEQNPAVKIIGADPLGSILCQYFYTRKMGEAKPYKVEGIGEDFIPSVYDFSVIDEIQTVNDRESLNLARRISREEGILVGGSCGTAAFAAIKIARGLGPESLVVVILPETGERYLSKVHSDDWMRENRLLDVEQVRVEEVIRGKTSGPLPALISIDSTDPLRKALYLIKEYDVSLIPVFRGKEVVGTLSDADVMEAALDDASALDRAVDSLMKKPLPTIDKSAHLSEAKRMLARRNPAVLVTDQSHVVAILTRFDVIEYEAA